MALGIGYGLPFVAQHGTNPYKTQWAAAREGAKGAGATVEDENAGAGSCLVSRGQDVYTDGLPFTPSLLIVPQFYKEGNLYQDVPPFVAEDSTMRFTVSRNTTATRVNSSGLIESVASGVPRIDWLGQSCPALLVEPSAQNLVLRSEEFNNAYWSKDPGVTVDSNVDVAPDGATTADRINLPVTGAVYYFGFSLSGSYTFSVYLKGEGQNIGKQVLLEFTNGNSTVTLTGNWQRFTTTGTNIVSVAIKRATSEQATSVLAWGAQVEVGSIATTYIPTTTAAVSRAADVISASGALVSGLIGQTEGTIYWEGAINRIDRVFFALASGSSTTQAVRLQTTGAGLLQGICIAGTVQGNVQTSGAITLGQFYKVAFAYKENDFVLYLNGVLQQSDTSGTLPTNLNSVYFCNSNGTEITDQRCRAAALYTTRLSNAQLAELTRL